jgi:FixJ family two-component response regulator
MTLSQQEPVDLASRPIIVSIIDDDASVREALESLVRSLGYAARAFDSAEAFLQSADLTETSCIVTDVQMPGLSGFDLCRRLKEAGITVPTVFITGFPESSAHSYAEVDNVLGCLTKPFDFRVLIELLASAVSRPAPR